MLQGLDPNAALLQVWTGLKDFPWIFIAVVVAVAWYGRHQFSKPTENLLQQTQIDPPKSTRPLTTFLRYQLGAGLYMLSWLLSLGFLVFIPGLMKLALSLFDDTAVVKSISDWLSETHSAISFPIAAAVILILVAKLPPISRVEQFLRNKCNARALIPAKARSMSEMIQEKSVDYPESLPAEIESDPHVARLKECHRVIYDDWLPICHFAAKIERWGGDPDFSRFAILYNRERKRLLQIKQKCYDKLQRFSCGLASKDAELSPEMASFIDGEVTSLSEEVKALLEQLYTFISHAILFSFATERARNDALSRLGIHPEDDRDRGSFPLDASALTLTWIAVFLIIIVWGLTLVALPQGWFGTEPSELDELNFREVVVFGLLGSCLHFGAVVLAVMLRRRLTQTGLGTVLEEKGKYRYPYGMYFALGVCVLILGGAFCVMGKMIFFPDPVSVHDMAWGLGAVITACAVGFYQDRAREREAVVRKPTASWTPRRWHDRISTGQCRG